MLPQRFSAMSKPLIVIFAAITLDAVGIGLIFPLLPLTSICRDLLSGYL